MMEFIGIDCASYSNKTGSALWELQRWIVPVLKCALDSQSGALSHVVLNRLHGNDESFIELDAFLDWSLNMVPCLSMHRAGQFVSLDTGRLFRCMKNVDIRYVSERHLRK